MHDDDLRPFLRAIHERPADVLPRLILADFLDEHGDWRGPLMRRPAPPVGRDVEATAVWLERLGDLHGVQWIGCRQGLLSVVMPAAAVYELPDSHLLKEAFRQGWVEHLDLLDNAGIPWADQLELQELPRLGFQRVDDETLENLPPLPELRELYLNNCWASRAELAWLRDLPRLEFVHVSFWGPRAALRPGQPILMGRFPHIEHEVLRLLSIPRLRSLTIHSTSMSNGGLETIGQLRTLKKLKLCRSGLVLGGVSEVGIRALTGLDQLEELGIGGYDLTNSALTVFSDLPRLRILRLQERHISADAIARFRAARPDVAVQLLAAPARVE